MQSFPALSKCINFVTTLSKKFLNIPQTQPLIICTDNLRQKSNQTNDTSSKQQDNQHLQIQNQNKNSLKQAYKLQQKSKLVNLNKLSLKEHVPLKETMIKKTGQQYKKNIQNNINRKSLFQQKFNNGKKQKQIQYFSNGIKKFDTNLVAKITSNIIAPRNNSIALNKQQETLKILNDNESKNEKKYKMIEKRNEKKNLFLFEHRNIKNLKHFTYQDGDDISSISAKSQTTDDIQPELLCFFGKNNMKTGMNTDQIYYDIKKKYYYHQAKPQIKINNQQNIKIPNENSQNQISQISQSQNTPNKKRTRLQSIQQKKLCRKRYYVNPSNNQNQQLSDPEQLGYKKQHQISYAIIQNQQKINQSYSIMDQQKNKSLIEQEIMFQEKNNQSFHKINNENIIQNNPLWIKNAKTTNNNKF